MMEHHALFHHITIAGYEKQEKCNPVPSFQFEVYISWFKYAQEQRAGDIIYKDYDISSEYWCYVIILTFLL